MALTRTEEKQILKAASRRLGSRGPVGFDKREIVAIARKIEPEISKCVLEIRKSLIGKESSLDDNTVIDFVIEVADRLRKR